jgi:hypothetical protein
MSNLIVATPNRHNCIRNRVLQSETHATDILCTHTTCRLCDNSWLLIEDTRKWGGGADHKSLNIVSMGFILWRQRSGVRKITEIYDIVVG